MENRGQNTRSSLSEVERRESLGELERRESWQSECSWGEESSTCLGLAIDGPWSSKIPAFDSQSEISTEVKRCHAKRPSQAFRTLMFVQSKFIV